MEKPASSARIERYLARHIRRAEPGGVLPSMRTLMRECRVGPATLATVLGEMEKRKLVVVKPQAGIFAASATGESQERLRISDVDIVFGAADPTQEESQNLFRQDLMLQLAEQTSARGYRIRLHAVERGPAALRQIHQIAAEEGCQACIVLRLVDAAQLDILREAHVPFVCIYPSLTAPPFNSVHLEMERIVHLQVEHLLSLGHRYVGYLHNVEPGSFHVGHVCRREKFYQLALDERLPIDSRYVQYGGYAPQQQKEGIWRLLELEPRPTAIICGDDHLKSLYHVARERHLQIGKDLSVIGTNDNQIAEAVDPAATTVRIPRKTAVTMALDMLEEVARSPDGRVANRFCEAQLIERQSTGPAA